MSDVIVQFKCLKVADADERAMLERFAHPEITTEDMVQEFEQMTYECHERNGHGCETCLGRAAHEAIRSRLAAPTVSATDADNKTLMRLAQDLGVPFSAAKIIYDKAWREVVAPRVSVTREWVVNYLVQDFDLEDAICLLRDAGVSVAGSGEEE